ncbi:MAG TPA: hypothetical protein VFY55_00530 [Nitrososphaeraceae archaeon]|nr:hypothetical protein [Nitrososphaeraceae archaeon]
MNLNGLYAFLVERLIYLTRIRKKEDLELDLDVVKEETSGEEYEEY